MHILDMLDLRLAVRVPEDGHQIKSGGGVLGVVLAEVGTCGSFNAAPFDGTGRVRHVGRFVRRARLHLDENDGIPVKRDQVNLADRAGEVSTENAVAVSAQESLGRTLAPRTEDQMPRLARWVIGVRPRRARATSTPPTLQPSDEREVHAASASCRRGRGGSRAWRDGPCRGASSPP